MGKCKIMSGGGAQLKVKNGKLAPNICIDDLIDRNTYVLVKSNADVLNTTTIPGSSNIGANSKVFKVDHNLDLYVTYTSYTYHLVLVKHNEAGIQCSNTVTIPSSYASYFDVYIDLQESRIVISVNTDRHYQYVWLFSFSDTTLKLVANTLLDSVTNSYHYLDQGNITKSNGLYVVPYSKTVHEQYSKYTDTAITSLRASDTSMSVVRTKWRGSSSAEYPDRESLYEIAVGSYLYEIGTKQLYSGLKELYLYKFDVQVSAIILKSSFLLGNLGDFKNVSYNISEDQSRLLIVTTRESSGYSVPKIDLWYFDLRNETPILLDWKAISLSSTNSENNTEIVLTKHDISTFVLSTSTPMNVSPVISAYVTGVFRLTDTSIILGAFISKSLPGGSVVNRGVHRVSDTKYTALLFNYQRLSTYSFELEDLTLVNSILREGLTNSYGEVLGDVAGLVSNKVVLLVPISPTLARYNTLDLETCSVVDSDFFNNKHAMFLKVYYRENGWILMSRLPEMAVYIKVKIYADGTILKYITKATTTIDGITKDKTIKDSINRVWLLNR